MTRISWLSHQAETTPDAPVLVLVTWPAGRDPAPLATTLVADGLVACANLLPEMRSIYRWQGAVQDDAERQLVLKTTAGRLEALHDHIRAQHPYELPEFLVVPVLAASAAYARWLRAAVTGDRAS